MDIEQVIKFAVDKAIAAAVPSKGIIRPKDFPDRYGMSIATVHRRLIDDPKFPKPIRVNNAGGLGFWIEEVEQYFRDKPRSDRYRGE